MNGERQSQAFGIEIAVRVSRTSIGVERPGDVLDLSIAELMLRFQYGAIGVEVHFLGGTAQQSTRHVHDQRGVGLIFLPRVRVTGGLNIYVAARVQKTVNTACAAHRWSRMDLQPMLGKRR
jgi:hypothetical protein